ncbi:MAG: hypothetical protein A2Z30_02440 [Chloroflexi bacterium RBG_16_64_43]|nr:MAG: hypothetical protein A2Z30_02440 [Chloroflexi bacterium RBG_16_64_43]
MREVLRLALAVSAALAGRDRVRHNALHEIQSGQALIGTCGLCVIAIDVQRAPRESKEELRANSRAAALHLAE